MAMTVRRSWCARLPASELLSMANVITGISGAASFSFLTVRDRPDLKETAAEWFHEKWGVPATAYLERMDAYLDGTTEYGWYLCVDGAKIVGGLGVIENDFHDRKDLAPNICAGDLHVDGYLRKSG